MTVHAEFYELSLSPSQNITVGRDTIILDTQIIYPKKISIGDTSAVLSMGGSISLFSLLYYYCLVRKRQISGEEYDSDELRNKEKMSSPHSYTLGIASPRGSSDSTWGGKSIVSSEDAQDFDEMTHQSSKSIMGSFPIVLDSKFQRATDIGENTRSKRSVTFSKVDTGWATFDEEVGGDSDLFMIQEEEAETDSCFEI